jgi:hypothetical protein
LTHCCRTAHGPNGTGAAPGDGTLPLANGLGRLLVLDYFAESVDKGRLVVRDEAQVGSFFRGVQQNEHLNVAGARRRLAREVDTASLKYTF